MAGRWRVVSMRQGDGGYTYFARLKAARSLPIIGLAKLCEGINRWSGVVCLAAGFVLPVSLARVA